MKHRTLRTRYVIIALPLALTVIMALLKPSDRGAPYAPYFAALNNDLKNNGPGRPIIIVDLDRLDRNLAILRSTIKPPLSYRIVVKSLPSLRLVRYIMDKTGTGKLMVFHQPDCNFLAEEFGGGVDILLGKPMPVNAVREFYRRFTGKKGFNPAAQLQWLVDTPERLKQYRDYAAGKNITLKINIEIDVGLHRGGVTNNTDLDRMLAMIESSRAALVFSGFMGYDVYAASAPALFTSKEKAVQSAFNGMLARYRAFYDHGRKKYPALFRGTLTFNSGGSQTYRLFKDQVPINDISVGSGLVKPSDFDTQMLTDHEKALFVATPVIKKLEGTTIPFLEHLTGLWPLWDPNKKNTFFIYGGGWRASYYSPYGLEDNSLYGKSTNQSIVNGSARTAIGVDDYIFLWPAQSEGIMREFGDIAIVRGGKVIDRWPAFPE
ncbi:MAG TPA: alanine racemase [Spirochaetota bacterium]|nr:alanine racemase [Spirochaetota bacterium]HPC40916.1 alanine racemase [Spirochaetota bacterium]HPL16043.1 alanine racemase [Spirochaetota bacterium]HQF08654.1 alanine racemase [Spirochaetota bacterium]HQH97369.1 alanine racemase [Spirochaetota bacterium]